MMKDMMDQEFGRWHVLSRVEDSRPQAYWLCRCSCGTERIVNGQNLRNGMSRSCGCLKSEIISRIKKGKKQALRHGHTTATSQSPEYRAWAKMKDRCMNVRCSSYKDYGGRGIGVCESWLSSFEAFLKDMGLKPSPKLSIDRIDNNGNYEPANCRWATQSQQNSNRRPYKRRVKT